MDPFPVGDRLEKLGSCDAIPRRFLSHFRIGNHTEPRRRLVGSSITREGKSRLLRDVETTNA